MNATITFDDAFIAALAAALAPLLAAPAATEEKTAEKPAATTKPAAGKKPVAEAKGPKRADVLEKVKELGNKTTRENGKSFVEKYAPTFAEVKDGDLAKLLADIDAAIKAVDEPSEPEAGDDY